MMEPLLRIHDLEAGYGWQRGAPYGPGTKNFEVILAWNKAQVYARTIAYFAERLDGMQ